MPIYVAFMMQAVGLIPVKLALLGGVQLHFYQLSHQLPCCVMSRYVPVFH